MQKIARIMIQIGLFIMIWGSLTGNLLVFGRAAESEPNDSEGTATPITKGIHTTGMELSSSSDRDYYSIYLNQGENISIMLWNFTTITNFGVYFKINGFYQMSPAGSYLNFTIETAGIYFIQVYAWAGGSGQYCLNISDFNAWDDSMEPNNGFGAAKELFKGKYENLVYLDADYYKTTCQVGTNLSVYLTRQPCTSGKLNLTIRDGAYSILAQQQNIDSYGAVSLLAIPQTGTYYIILSSDNPYAFSNYTLILANSMDDGYEDNDNFSSAAPITIGSNNYLTLFDPDYFYFSCSLGQSFVLFLSRSGGIGNFNFTVFDSSYVMYKQRTNIGSSSSQEIQIINAQSTQYYLQINGDQTGFGNYSISLNIVTDDSFEDNDDWASAAIITQQSYTNLALYDADYYKIGFVEGDLIRIDLYKSNGEGSFNFEIYDQSFKNLGQKFTIFQESLTLTNLSYTGPYYIRVLPNSTQSFGNYSLFFTTVSDDLMEENDDLSHASQINIGNYKSLSLYDKDFYNFSVTMGSNFSIIMNRTLFSNNQYQIGINFSLYLPNGTLVRFYRLSIYNEWSYQKVEFWITNSLLAGNYTLAIIPDENAYAQYDITLGYIYGDDIYENNDDPTMATPISFGTTSGLYAWDKDYYNLTLQANENASIRVNYYSSETIRIFKSDGIEVKRVSYEPEYLILKNLELSNYTIEVSPSSNSLYPYPPFSYSIQIDIIYDDCFEDNDDMAHATVLGFGMNRNLACYDLDFYNVTLSVNDNISIVINDTDASLKAKIYDPNGELLFQKNNWQMTIIHLKTVMLAGMYCIRIEINNSAEYSNYTLSIIQGLLDDISEENDDFGNAKPLIMASNSAYYNPSIEYNNPGILADDEYYSFNASTNEYLEFVLNLYDFDLLPFVNLELFNQTHNLIKEGYIGKMDIYDVQRLNFTCNSSGMYYLKISCEKSDLSYYVLVGQTVAFSKIEDFTMIYGESGKSLNWTLSGVSDFYLGNITHNSLLFLTYYSYNTNTINNNSIIISLNNLPVGVHTYKISVMSYFITYFESEVTITVFASNTNPSLTHPVDLTYIVGTSNHNISWIVTDLEYSATSYSITRNGTIITTGTWISGNNVSITVDGLSAGHYEYCLSVSDGFGGSTEDRVLVHVNSTNTTPPPDDTTPSNTDPEPDGAESWISTLLEWLAQPTNLLIVGAVGVGIILVIWKFKKKH